MRLESSFGAVPEGQWYSINYNGFDYREGAVACRNLSNEAMIDFEIAELSEDEDESMFGQVLINCNNLPLQARDCLFSLVSSSRVISNLTCEGTSEYREGDIRQLQDGRIVQLKEIAPGQFIWAHFCAENDENWDFDVSNLACQSLGYERARKGNNNHKGSVENRFVYGLMDINCNGATEFRHCTSDSSDRGQEKGECYRDEVITVFCEGNPSETTDQMTTIPSVHTVKNSYSATKALTTSTAYRGTYHPSYTTKSTKDSTFIAQYKTYLIAGGISLGVSLFVCTVGLCLVVGIAIYISRVCYRIKPNPKEEINTTAEIGVENREHDHYARMEPCPNGFVKQDSEQDKQYYNTEDLVNNPTQCYHQIQPLQNSSGSTESCYAYIQSV